MTHKPRGRQSNFFDGGVFGAIMYQGVFQTIPGFLQYMVGVLFSQNIIHKQKFMQMPLQWPMQHLD